ncbi:2-methylisocitrate lyase [Madurella mycetomatis]|uniref:2-methylisocitrate lyase n=1 Tax=Madurella mycetomatis TaxID=100816 RepID=A0A175W2R5_9PEZI|nr:2-methylisocitrate lyase [Madurella mycetomatis]
MSSQAPSLTALAALATSFKALHVPGNPLFLTNVHDATSARIVASLPGCRALATASWAVAQCAGTTDEKLTFDQNMAALAPIAAVAREFSLPLTVDIQDGYGDRLEEVVRRVITELGAVGVNLEDSDHETGAMMSDAVAVERIRRVLDVAREVGVADFVVNARSDSFLVGGEIDESIRRGRKYLDAGATTVYVFWPRQLEMLEADIKKVIDGLDGKANIQPRLNKGMTDADIARLGAARVSVGPQLYHATVDALKKTANLVFGAAE